MVNVLPLKEQKRMRTRYYTHLAIVVCLIGVVVLVAGALFLAPSYFLARDQVDAGERYRDAVAGTIDLKEANNIEQSVSELNERIRIGKEFQDTALFAPLITEFALVDREGVAIALMSFSRAENGASVRIAGVADTREELLRFAENLRASGGFREVALPVSQLVSEEDLIFSIEAVYVKK